MTRAYRALVVGDLMLDRYWFGQTARISPEAPVPVVDVEHEQTRLGGAANVASNLVSLGLETRLLGLVGNDLAGEQLLALAKTHAIDTDFVRLEHGPTVVKQRVVSRNQQLVRVDFESNGDVSDVEAGADALIRRAVAALAEFDDDDACRFDVVVCSDYAKGALNDPGALIDAARARQIPVIVDPKSGDWGRFHGATVITPNLAELRAAIGPWPDEATLAAAIETQRQRHALDTVVLTRSGEGLSVYGEASPIHRPAVAREVFDVTGAGDTVTAILALGLAGGQSMPEAAAAANRGASIVVARLGTATVKPAELHPAIQPASHTPVEWPTLLDWVVARRTAGERIVFTNGCFDVLHPGHIDCLTRAAEHGDRLIVAVNDDASVRALKGPDRPITPLADRVAMLNALAVVDRVAAFDGPTPALLIDAIVPDVLVKGGDYSADDIVGADTVRAAGGSVVVVDTLPGYASRDIIQAIRASAPAE